MTEFDLDKDFDKWAKEITARINAMPKVFKYLNDRIEELEKQIQELKDTSA